MNRYRKHVYANNGGTMVVRFITDNYVEVVSVSGQCAHHYVGERYNASNINDKHVWQKIMPSDYLSIPILDMGI